MLLQWPASPWPLIRSFDKHLLSTRTLRTALPVRPPAQLPRYPLFSSFRPPLTDSLTSLFLVLQLLGTQRCVQLPTLFHILTYPLSHPLIHPSPLLHPQSTDLSIMHIPIYPPTHPSSTHPPIIHPSMHSLSIHPSTHYPSIIHPSSIHLSIHHPPTHPSSIHPPIHPFIPSSVHLSTHPPSQAPTHSLIQQN